MALSCIADNKILGHIKVRELFVAERLLGCQKGLASTEYVLHSVLPADNMRCTAAANDGYG